MKSITVPYGEWLPDQPDRGAAVTNVENAIPKETSYRSVGALTAVSDAIDSACLGSFWAESGGSYFNFAGDAAKLYKMDAYAFTNKSKGGNYSSVESWEFVRWGDRVIATSLEEPPQYYDMGTSTLFADLPGTPPKAKHIAVVRDFIVMGNLDESGTVTTNKIRWSGYNNSELWTSSLATQSDSQELFGRGGAVQKITPGEEGYIFQEHAIRRMSYVGPPLIFQIDEVERDRGAYAGNSVCWWGSQYYYYAHDGFHVFDGAISTPIGQGKVDLHVRADLDTNNLTAFRGAVDRQNKLVVWTYPSTSKGRNTLLFYHIPTGKWSSVDQEVEFVLEHAAAGYDLDTIDALLTNGIDTDSFDMDSGAYRGGTVSLGGFDSSHKLATFSGEALTATIETRETDAPIGKRLSVKSVRPLNDGTSSICVGTRDNQSENFSYGSPATANVKGEMNFRTSSRYVRFKDTITGGFNDAEGVEMFYREEGRR